MSTLWSETYDYPVAITPSDTVADPAGPFAGALCSVAGNAVVVPLNGAQTPVTIACVAGEYLRFPILRFGASTTGTYFGLCSAIVRQGK